VQAEILAATEPATEPAELRRKYHMYLPDMAEHSQVTCVVQWETLLLYTSYNKPTDAVAHIFRPYPV
jgi:hypothetical protein